MHAEEKELLHQDVTQIVLKQSQTQNFSGATERLGYLWASLEGAQGGWSASLGENTGGKGKRLA